MQPGQEKMTYPTVSPQIINICFELVTALYVEFIKEEAAKLDLLIDDNTARNLAHGAGGKVVLAAGSSGGKDSDALVLLLNKLMDAIGFAGRRVVIHSDLGAIEHVESQPQAERLAKFVGWEFLVARRKQGGLISRYYQRWKDNLTRYANLEMVTMLSPFPIPTSAPFCRSEVKVSPLCQKLVKMFPGCIIINAVGIRGEESKERALKPISRPNDKLHRADGTTGFDWFPLRDTLEPVVWQIHRTEGFGEHIQYSRGNRRISCAYCFLGQPDWKHALKVETNHPSYIRMCALELRSSFAYTAQHWLVDEEYAAAILPAEMLSRIEEAKLTNARRLFIEKKIPTCLLFKNHGGKNNWPEFQPSLAQCEIIADVRRRMAALMGEEVKATTGLEIRYTTAQEVYGRYAELIAVKEAKLAKVAQKAARQSDPNRKRRGPRKKRLAALVDKPSEELPSVDAAVIAGAHGGGLQQQSFMF